MGISTSIMIYLHMSVVKLSVQSAKVPVLQMQVLFHRPGSTAQATVKHDAERHDGHTRELIDMGDNEDAYQALCAAMKEGWESIPQEKIDNLIKGMDRRVEACRLAKGWHTKY